MITEAILLGAVEAAVYRQDNRWRAIRLAPSGKGTIDCTRSLALLMDSRAEQRALAEPLRDIHELEARLRVWSRRHRTLKLLIAGMDPLLTDGTRQICIRAAEESLWDNDISHFVRARLLGCPVPEEADIGGGLRLCREIGGYAAEGPADKRLTGERITVGRVTPEGLYGALREVEGVIPVVRRILDEVLFFGPDTETNPEAARWVMIDAGVVAEAVLALARKSVTALDQLVEDYSKNPSLVAELGNPRPVLRQFESRIRKRFESRIRELIEQRRYTRRMEEEFFRVPGLFDAFPEPGMAAQETVDRSLSWEHPTPVWREGSEIFREGLDSSVYSMLRQGRAHHDSPAPTIFPEGGVKAYPVPYRSSGPRCGRSDSRHRDPEPRRRASEPR